MARSARLAGRLPNCILVNQKKKLFILLRVNGESVDFPDEWKEWGGSLSYLKRNAFNQIMTESEALKCLPKEIVRLRV